MGILSRGLWVGAAASAWFVACASSSGGGGGVSCLDGGACPTGSTCGPNGVCVPIGSGGSAGSGFGGSGGSGFGGSGGSGFGGSGGSGFGGSGGSGFGGSGGSGFGGSGGSGFGGSGGSGGSGFGGTGGSGTIQLGRACVTSAECGAGLTCVTAGSGAFDGAGPAKGYCTASCTADPSICSQFDPSAVCLEFATGGGSYCIEGCNFGPTTLQQFHPNKCHGRQEVSCAPLFSDSGNPCSGGVCPSGQICGTTNTCLDIIPSCLPQCNSNADCGSGLYCDPSDGLCRSTPATGKSVGAACTQNLDASTDECKGNCTGLVHSGGSTPFTYVCTETCTLGASPACGWSGSGPAPAACLFVSTVILNNGGSGIGDRGSCGQLCDCNSQCGNPALTCIPFNDITIESFYQKKGYCSDPQLPGGGTDPGIPSCT